MYQAWNNGRNWTLKKRFKIKIIAHKGAFFCDKCKKPVRIGIELKDNGKSKNVKISGFGSFTYKRTPAREGRNPKNNEFFEIKSFKRLIFKPSNILKKNIWW